MRSLWKLLNRFYSLFKGHYAVPQSIMASSFILIIVGQIFVYFFGNKTQPISEAVFMLILFPLFVSGPFWTIAWNVEMCKLDEKEEMERMQNR